MEGGEPVQSGQPHRNGTGEVVEGKIENGEAVEGENGRRQGAGEVVAVQEEGLEVLERGEVGDGAGERVVVETQDSELVEASESVGRKLAAERVRLQNETDDAALGALDALPLAVVETLV